MIQNFDVQGGPEFGRRNLPKLRAALAGANLDGFLIPHEDEYQNEYLPDCNERLMWITGFTGSAGAAIVTTHRAAIFVDGRYTLQVRGQVDAELFDYESLEGGGMAGWVSANATEGMRLGYDARLHSPAGLHKLKAAAKTSGAALIPVDKNPIDAAWDDRPPAPLTQITVQPLELAGESHADKRARIGNLISEAGADAAVLTSPASVAWLLNIRGADVMCTPLPLSTVILHANGNAELYVHPDKVGDDVLTHLGNSVVMRDEDMLEGGLNAFSNKRVWVDPGTASAHLFETLKAAGASLHSATDPVMLPKAAKNDAEIAGTKAAHIRDGGALTRFLHWLATDAQSGDYDEIQAAQKLEYFRAQLPGLKDLSFETISGAGSNGAFCHYRVNTDTNLKLEPGSLYLVDSGGQYRDGTTDVTRTVAIGKPSEEMRRRFTLVLKGHIALASVRFPPGTTGSNLDALARMALWKDGLDYDHGTGHGVGAYLGVHEGPQRISKAPNTVTLLPGMIVSNEPGYYKTGGYGIRIENLQFVHEPREIDDGERPMLGFENLTWAPIDRTLVDADLLSDFERNWLNDYHAQVWEKIGPQVEGDVKAWLKGTCEAL